VRDQHVDSCSNAVVRLSRKRRVFRDHGQGFEENLVGHLKNEGYARGLIAGSCAIDEIGPEFIKAFGKGNIYFSNDCCNVAETVSAVVKLTGLSTFALLPASAMRSLALIVSAKLHGSRAILTRLF